jgi:hypothetical protein
LRLRLQALRRDPELCAQFIGKLARHPGVHHVSANPKSGGILIHFDPAMAHADMLAALSLPSPPLRAG